MNYITAAVLALLLALASYGWYTADAEATRYKDELSTANAALEQARTRTASIQKQVQSANTDAANARRSLKEVLDAAPMYRDSPTPAAVVDSLCRTLRCSGASSVSAPGS